FSSRRRHTRFSRDWSSDVCSSDLTVAPWRGRNRCVELVEELGPLAAATDGVVADLTERRAAERLLERDHTLWQDDPTEVADRLRSEERRVGKEGRSGRSAEQERNE